MIEKTPNSPAELMAMNEKKDLQARLSEIMGEATLREALVFIRDELEDLYRHHKMMTKAMIKEMHKCEDVIKKDQMTDEIDQWIEDTKHLQAAWDQVRLVHLGPEPLSSD